jgi:hypothetical protein
LQRDGSEPGREGNRAALELPYDEESRSKSRPTLSRHMKFFFSKGRSHVALHKPCHAECAVSESVRAREVSLHRITAVMAVYHRKCRLVGGGHQHLCYGLVLSPVSMNYRVSPHPRRINNILMIL